MAIADRGTIPGSELKISPATTKKMTDTIIENTNAVVDENDTLVHEGDLLFGPRDELFERLRAYRRRIACKNMILIWGNHDEALADLYYQCGRYKDQRWRFASEETRQMFVGVYEQRMFNVNGQKIFCNHYPFRSWDCSHHGAWMLYGHVHNLFKYEDNGKLQPYKEHTLREGFERIIGNNTGQNDPGIVQECLDLVASLNGTDFTVDVGVDNDIRSDVPWGTPWSMDHLFEYMGKKTARWNERKLQQQNFVPKGSLK